MSAVARFSNWTNDAHVPKYCVIRPILDAMQSESRRGVATVTIYLAEPFLRAYERDVGGFRDASVREPKEGGRVRVLAGAEVLYKPSLCKTSAELIFDNGRSRRLTVLA